LLFWGWFGFVFNLPVFASSLFNPGSLLFWGWFGFVFNLPAFASSLFNPGSLLFGVVWLHWD